MSRSSTNQDKQLLKKLLRWYEREGRPVHIRRLKDPYKIWISEVILQQTQLSRGTEYYKRFVKRFPNVRVLAAAKWPSVLQVWRGLGYYNRGRNLLKAAKVIVEEHEGKLPKDYSQLTALPGIGPYTANAILSFAYGKPVPAIDTNLTRVLQRMYGCPKSQLQVRSEELFLLKPRSSKKLNYALMDLGATLCTPKNPNCAQCPLAHSCDFYQSGRPTVIPQSKQRTATKQRTRKPIISVAIGCIHREGKYLLAKRKRKKGGNWEFPGGKQETGETLRNAVKREIQEEVGIEVSVRPPFLVKEFDDNTYRWQLSFCRCQILAGKPEAFEHEEIAWVPKEELPRYKMPSMNDDAVKKLMKFR